MGSRTDSVSIGGLSPSTDLTLFHSSIHVKVDLLVWFWFLIRFLCCLLCRSARILHAVLGLHYPLLYLRDDAWGEGELL